MESRTPAWRELLAIVGLALIYLVVRRVVSHNAEAAITNGRTVLAIEGWLHASPELAMNRWLAGQGWLREAAADFYDAAALAVTVYVASWAWLRRPGTSRVVRNEMVLALLISFAVFTLFPVAPPRLEGGHFLDITAHGGSIRSWYGAYSQYLDQIAALPSIHVISACWCLLAVRKLVRRRKVRLLLELAGAAYVVLTGLVVMATANHYLLDVLAAALTSVIAVVLAEFVLPRVRLRRGLAGSGRGGGRRFFPG